MEQARIAALQRMPVFGAIRGDILEFICSLSPIVAVAKGDFFFRENDKADSMFVLEAGRVAVLKDWRGQPCPLGTLGKGDCFGEMGLIDLYPRSASVRALEDCSAMEISAAGLYKIYEKDLEQFTIIQMNIGREVSRRLREADEHLFRAKMGEPSFPLEYILQSA